MNELDEWTRIQLPVQQFSESFFTLHSQSPCPKAEAREKEMGGVDRWNNNLNVCLFRLFARLQLAPFGEEYTIRDFDLSTQHHYDVRFDTWL